MAANLTASPSGLPSAAPTAFPFIEQRYQPWDLLDGVIKAAATDQLSYVKETWDLPGTNEVEELSFSSLDINQQSGANVIGFNEVTWDCWVNHYIDYEWEELATEEVQEFYVALGWNESNWNEEPGSSPPDTETTPWNELTSEEQAGANELCFFRELWDGLNLTDWGTEAPSTFPSGAPSSFPSEAPSAFPTVLPSLQPSAEGTLTPSTSTNPSSEATSHPSNMPSTSPSATSSGVPSSFPSFTSQPSSYVSSSPSSNPSKTPSDSPSTTPTRQPSQPASTSKGVPSQQPMLLGFCLCLLSLSFLIVD